MAANQVSVRRLRRHSNVRALNTSNCSKPVREDEAAFPTTSRTNAPASKPSWASMRRCCVNTHSASSTASATLVNEANWLRWRRLAKASPIGAQLIQGANRSASPKYCRRANALLRRPATLQGIRMQHQIEGAPPISPDDGSCHANTVPKAMRPNAPASAADSYGSSKAGRGQRATSSVIMATAQRRRYGIQSRKPGFRSNSDASTATTAANALNNQGETDATGPDEKGLSHISVHGATTPVLTASAQAALENTTVQTSCQSQPGASRCSLVRGTRRFPSDPMRHVLPRSAPQNERGTTPEASDWPFQDRH